MFPLTTDRIRRLVSAFLILKAGLARADGPAYWKDITIEPVDCPAGSKWIEWTNSFVTGSTRIDNPYDVWTAARGMPEVHDGTGLPLKLQQGLGKSKP